MKKTDTTVYLTRLQIVRDLNKSSRHRWQCTWPEALKRLKKSECGCCIDGKDCLDLLILASLLKVGDSYRGLL